MEAVTKISPQTPSQSKKLTGRAVVSYPYFDLTKSLEVAKTIYDRAGGMCEPDQLVTLLDYKTVKSGTFITRISAARQFGLVRHDTGKIVITERAKQIISPVMPDDAQNGLIDAFLCVELFAKVYDQFRGNVLPSSDGLRNLFLNVFGITPDRVEPAMRVFINSAQQAGFFPSGDRSKLVRPISNQLGRDQKNEDTSAKPIEPASERPIGTSQNSSGGGDPPPGIHTAIVGLLRELPSPGAEWPKGSKRRFIKAFLATLDFVYPDADAEIEPNDAENQS